MQINMLCCGNRDSLVSGQPNCQKASMLLVVQLTLTTQYGGGAATSSGQQLYLKQLIRWQQLCMRLKTIKCQRFNVLNCSSSGRCHPITGFVYGDNAADIYAKGGVWWLGNLKGCGIT